MSSKKNENGNFYFTMKLQDANPEKTVSIPCGRCMQCRIRKSREWAIRCSHEASMWKNNCFITLTLSPDELSKRDNPHTLVKKDFQDFMKRLRKNYGGKEFKQIDQKTVNPIKYYMAGEYGDKKFRPHYHACLFNFDFDDKYHWQTTKLGFKLYRSPALEKLWPLGYSSIAPVNMATAGYVARYTTKKKFGDQAKEKYEFIDDNGVIFDRLPEYSTMSLKTAIGKEYAEQNTDNLHNDMVWVTNKGKRVTFKPPKYYDGIFELYDPQQSKKIKKERLKKAKRYAKQDTDTRPIYIRDRAFQEQVANKLKRSNPVT